MSLTPKLCVDTYWHIFGQLYVTLRRNLGLKGEGDLEAETAALTALQALFGQPLQRAIADEVSSVLSNAGVVEVAKHVLEAAGALDDLDKCKAWTTTLMGLGCCDKSHCGSDTLKHAEEFIKGPQDLRMMAGMAITIDGTSLSFGVAMIALLTRSACVHMNNMGANHDKESDITTTTELHKQFTNCKASSLEVGKIRALWLPLPSSRAPQPYRACLFSRNCVARSLRDVMLLSVRSEHLYTLLGTHGGQVAFMLVRLSCRHRLRPFRNY